MNVPTLRIVLLTACSVSATLAPATERSLPTPSPDGYVDTESSVNVPLTDWPDLGRRVKIDLTAYATPSNAIQIAFGQDTNGDEDLEPEEIMLVLGVDCGEPFVREEEVGVGSWSWRAEVGSCSAGQPNGEATSSSLQNEGGDHHSSTSTFNFNFRQPQAVADRITHAKVTTRGREDTAAQIAAEIKKPGIVLLLR